MNNIYILLFLILLTLGIYALICIYRIENFSGDPKDIKKGMKAWLGIYLKQIQLLNGVLKTVGDGLQKVDITTTF